MYFYSEMARAYLTPCGMALAAVMNLTVVKQRLAERQSGAREMWLAPGQ
jgi:hypothetical protein